MHDQDVTWGIADHRGGYPAQNGLGHHRPSARPGDDQVRVDVFGRPDNRPHRLSCDNPRNNRYVFEPFGGLFEDLARVRLGPEISLGYALL